MRREKKKKKITGFQVTHVKIYYSLPDYMTRTSFFECKGGHFEFTTNLPMSDIAMFIYDTFYQYYFINIQ